MVDSGGNWSDDFRSVASRIKRGRNRYAASDALATTAALAIVRGVLDADRLRDQFPEVCRRIAADIASESGSFSARIRPHPAQCFTGYDEGAYLPLLITVASPGPLR